MLRLTLLNTVSTPSDRLKLMLAKLAGLVGVPDSVPPALRLIPGGRPFVAVHVPVEPPAPLSAVSVYGPNGTPTNASGSWFSFTVSAVIRIEPARSTESLPLLTRIVTGQLSLASD